MTNRHYSLAEKHYAIAVHTDLKDADVETLARMFDYLTFAELKRVAKVTSLLSKGKPD